MYYEEQIVNGILMQRAAPKGEWRECSANSLYEQIIDLRNTIIDLKACLRTCANSANGGLEQCKRG